MKLHKHYYMMHLTAMSVAYHDVLLDAQNAPDGSNDDEQETVETSDSSDMGDSEISGFSCSSSDCDTLRLETIPDKKVESQ